MKPLLSGMPGRKFLRVPLWRYLCIFSSTKCPSNDNRHAWWKQL